MYLTIYIFCHLYLIPQLSRIIEIQPTTPNPTTTQPTDAPVTLAPVTPSPVTNEPTNSPVQEGAGYCSNNEAKSCLTDSECGCSARRRGLRMLAKPRCNDGTNRLSCADCTCGDLECEGDPSCAAPTTSNPTLSPSAPPTGVELTPVPTNSPVTNTPTTDQVSHLIWFVCCIDALLYCMMLL